VVKNSAASAALSVTSLIEPIVQSGDDEAPLSREQVAALDELFSKAPLSQRIVSFKIWRKDGLIVYSSRGNLVGRRFEVGPNQQLAWAGGIGAEFDNLSDVENEGEQKLGIPILEIYAPMRAAGSDKIIAVCEFYDNADTFHRDAMQAQVESWQVIGTSGLVTFLVLLGVVRRAGRTIEGQRVALADRVGDLTRALDHNKELNARVDEANRRSIETSDRFMRRIGAELHDGPAQLLALALLRLDGMAPPQATRHENIEGPAGVDEVETMRSIIGDALGEIRNISGGLALPELEVTSLSDALEMCADVHERRTGTVVKREIDTIEGEVPIAAKICLYRVAQEGLTNAFRHAGGSDQTLALKKSGSSVTMRVSNTGAGFDVAETLSRDRLGLIWMQDRMRSIGGVLELKSNQGQGTVLTATLQLGRLQDRNE